MRDEIRRCLEELLTGKNSTGKPLISGFNHHARSIEYTTPTILTFSHVHSRAEYLSKLTEDFQNMGYPDENVAMTIRDKKGYFRWKPNFVIRSKGILQENLHIRNIENGEYIDLEKIPFETLKDAGYSAEYADKLIANDKGYEIIIHLADENDIYNIASRFLMKSSKEAYLAYEFLIGNNKEDRRTEDPWPGAYDVPVLIIAGDLKRIEKQLVGFGPARLFRCKDASSGEYNFVTSERSAFLKQTEEYSKLLQLGFVETLCLANEQFIKEYVETFE